jgi:hypothetical protein
MSVRTLLLVVGAGALACAFACGASHAGGGSSGTTSGASSDCAASSSNDAMMKALAPTCAGCHTQGAKPFFASLKSFEDLLVYNPAYITPGHPETSSLIPLLSGQGTGTYKQMPLSGEPFATLASEGKTKASLEDVKKWIAGIAARPLDARPDPAAATVQRLSAEQIRATLYAQLGLGESDFFSQSPTANRGTPGALSLGEDLYPVYGADDAPGAIDDPPIRRHAALGGAQTSEIKARDLSPGPAFALSIAALSQAWCKIAIAKPKSILFPKVSPSAASASSADAIKQNIGYLTLHFLGEPAVPADVDDVFQNVFVPLETASDPKTAWAGVCSYFIRHPKWIFN